jgi:hypothetical protein
MAVTISSGITIGPGINIGATPITMYGLQLYSYFLYNTKLSLREISGNYQALRSRFGV